MRLPERCPCGALFDIQHALSCKKGGFVTQRHNTLRDVTARLMAEVCSDVKVEPPLNHLTGEKLQEKSANTSDEARLDVSARGFWVTGQRAFFDIRVFNPIARRYNDLSIKRSHETNEREKKRQYNERVQRVEHGSFSPLVFNAFGGMARECSMTFKRLIDRQAEAEHQHGIRLGQKENKLFPHEILGYLHSRHKTSLVPRELSCVLTQQGHRNL